MLNKLPKFTLKSYHRFIYFICSIHFVSGFIHLIRFIQIEGFTEQKIIEFMLGMFSIACITFGLMLTYHNTPKQSRQIRRKEERRKRGKKS